MNESAKKVKTSLEAQCARREYCSSDILKKAVGRLDGDAQAAREVLDALVKDGFVSDLRYATAFAREKARLTGWGPVKIRFALSAKKISAADISSALGEIEAGEADARLNRLLEAKYKTLEGDPQIRLKLLKFALSRGYEYDKVEGKVAALTSRKAD